MKKSFILSALFYLFSFSTLLASSTCMVSDTIIPFTSKDNEWLFYSEDSICTYAKFAKEDTIINGLSYSMLRLKKYDEEEYSEKSQHFYRQEDSIVYKIHPEDTTEFVIMDYTVEVGDSIDLRTIYGVKRFLVEDKVAKKYQNGNYFFLFGYYYSNRKEKLDCTYTYGEGFGFYHKQFIEESLCDHDRRSFLLSFSHKGEVLLKYFQEDLCTVSTASSTILGLKIFPNPTSDMLHIESSERLKRVMIYSSSGVLVKTINSDFNAINLGYIKSGMYYLDIQDVNGNRARRKVMKLGF